MRRKLVSRIATEHRFGAPADHSTEEKDLVIIGGGVAGYVAAIKAGQAGMKVSIIPPDNGNNTKLTHLDRSLVSKSAAPLAEPA
jgi:heterodisulfide reductase subunit A-like polyferredoxin